MPRAPAAILLALLFSPRLPVSASPGLPTTRPTPPSRIVTIQPGASLRLLDIDDDGRTAYILATVKQVNAFRIALWYWPEALAAVIALVALVMLRRALRRRQVPGEEHCRRCNYLIRGITSDRCPECGTELTLHNRVRGRRTWPRVTIASGTLLLVLLAYALSQGQLPRAGTWSDRLDWRSTALATWAMKHQHDWLARHAAEDDLLLAIDLATGQVTRQVCRLRLGDDRIFFSITLTADRRFLFGLRSSPRHETSEAGYHPQIVCRVDTASGKVLEHPLVDGDESLFDIGISPAGRVVFRRGVHKVAAYDAATGHAIARIDAPARVTYQGLVAIDARERDWALLFPIVDAADDGAPHLWGPPGVAPVPLRGLPYWPPSTDWDAGRGYEWSADEGGALSTWDPVDGRRLDHFRVGEPTPNPHRLAVRGRTATVEHGDILAVSIHIIDLPTHTFRGTIRTDGTLTATAIPTRDGRRVAAMHTTRSGDELRIWDLPFPVPGTP